MKIQGFLVYRVWYGNALVYVGRTKQPLQDRIRGHLFQRPMHRTIDIAQVTKIEYAEFKTEADMNLYEIYFILKEHPPLNVDDKAKDFPTVELPPVEWKEFSTRLWDKWTDELERKAGVRERLLRRYHQIPEEIRVLRSANKTGELSDEEFWDRKEALVKELDGLNQAIWGR